MEDDQDYTTLFPATLNAAKPTLENARTLSIKIYEYKLVNGLVFALDLA
jgi:hypothetical protein